MSISMQPGVLRDVATRDRSTAELDDWSDVRDFAERVARARARSTAIDPRFAEDIAQEVTLSVLRQAGDARVAKSLVARMTTNVVARAAHADRTGRGVENFDRVNSADMKAWKLLAQRRAEREARLGRALDSGELDALAEHIRGEWSDVRHRPAADFHVDVRRVEADPRDAVSPVDAAGYSAASAEEAALADEEEGGYMAAALDAVSAPGADRRDRTPLRLAHNAVAERRGAPVAVAGALSQRRCTRARKVVGTTAEEVLAAAEHWAAGGDDERTELLFAPYGELSNAGKTAVVDLYRDLRAYAGELYASALMFANTRLADDAR